MLTSKQRSYLRSVANTKRDDVIVGKESMSGNVIDKIQEALYNGELVKIKLLQTCPDGVAECAARLQEQTGCDIIGTIGRKIIAYKQNPDKAAIQLPDGKL
ncbi:MAG: YhbY family RNA-binding protein [Eubacteriaceae bacterium]|nr:YhbY family RNA-binding protein [Eubacteriaceae bacterium]